MRNGRKGTVSRRKQRTEEKTKVQEFKHKKLRAQKVVMKEAKQQEKTAK